MKTQHMRPKPKPRLFNLLRLKRQLLRRLERKNLLLSFSKSRRSLRLKSAELKTKSRLNKRRKSKRELQQRNYNKNKKQLLNLLLILQK